ASRAGRPPAEATPPREQASELADMRRQLSEALQRETATADVLKVISRSTFDLQNVLNTMVTLAANLCDAQIVNIWRPAGGAIYRLAASYGVESRQAEWLTYRQYLSSLAYVPGKDTVVGRVLLKGKTVQIDDVRADPDYDQRGALAG